MLGFLLLTLAVSTVQGQFDEVQKELNEAEARWEHEAIERYSNNYGFTQKRECNCLPCQRAEQRVHVENGAVVKVNYIGNVTDSDGVLCSEEYPLTANDGMCVHRLFDEIQQFIDIPVDDLRVTFDAHLGYPSDVFVDFDEDVAGEEMRFKVYHVKMKPHK